ncbi:MAG: YdcF family protein [Acidobacteriota bacterium]|nr:YdcF family protein [Acidobacteriota bacterium]
MLFFLRKLIEAAFMPLGFSVLLCILGVILRRRSLVIVGILILLLAGTPVGGRLLMAPLERVYPATSIAASPYADAVVVLSGGILRGINPAGVQWGESANRYFAGLDLALAGKARRLVISTGMPPSPGQISQGIVLRQVAIARGFPADRILLTRPVLTTEDEASAVSTLPGIHSILLVTSAFHMPRATMLFRAHDLQVVPFPTDQRVFGSFLSNSTQAIPGSAPLEGTELALREYYGLAVYRTLLVFHPHL